jgi:chromate transporter
MYRFGSIVFGGADVLVPMMYEQYVVRPQSQRIKQQNQQVIKISRDNFLTGAGIVRAIPGPVFSIASFIGGLSMSSKGFLYQLFGCFIAAIGIFLPSCLLVLFFYPIWESLHRFLILQQIIKGINAAVVGIMIAGIVYLIKDTVTPFIGAPVISSILFFSVLISTFLLLMYTRIPAPLIALSAILLGIIIQ